MYAGEEIVYYEDKKNWFVYEDKKNWFEKLVR